MKKYSKPTISIENIEILTVISTSAVINFGVKPVEGDQTVDFADFGTGEWN